MQNTIFDLHPAPPPPPPPTGSILFFSGRGRVQIYPGDSNRRIGRENENDNPVRKCTSIITFIFGFLMTLGRHSEGCFYVVVSQGNSGNIVGKW